jgi:hypothetical protein
VAGKYPKLAGRLKSNIAETLIFYALPRAPHKHIEEHEPGYAAERGDQAR